MAPPSVKRSVSFDLLSRDDAGDGDDLAEAAENEPATEKRRRRRSRKNKQLLRKSFSLSPGSSGDIAGIVDLVAQEIGDEVPKFPVGNGTVHQKEDDGGGISAVEQGFRGGHGEIGIDAVHANGNLCPPALESTENALDHGERDGISTPKENGIHPIHADGYSSPPVLGSAENGSEKAFDRVEVDKSETKADDLAVESWQDSFPLDLIGGSSLEAAIRAGDQRSRDRVYNALISVPWRCELLILVGFLACLDSFLSLLVAMPIRLALALWKRLRERRAFQASDLSDIGCSAVLLLGVFFLQQTDISYIYHSIRFEPNIKLYVIYNMLEVFDKLFQSFGVDVLQVLFYTATKYVANATGFKTVAFDWMIAVGCFVVHSFIIFLEAITLSAALHNANTNRSLLILLMSNNFAEIKSTVFKRFNKDNMHDLAHSDTVERFHILTCLFFAFAQNIIRADGRWMPLFFYHAAMVMTCEAFVDLIKHSFLAKVNHVMPSAYTEFLEKLCEQIVSRKYEIRGRALKFIPLAPACVVIKVLFPLYASYLSSTSSAWTPILRFIFVAGGTVAILVALQIVVRLLLHRYAAWYLRDAAHVTVTVNF